MVDAQRALLDELMGTARNLTDEEKKGYREICWDDNEVCGCYLIRFCPHDLFVNTKSNLGPCTKIHDQKLKESFEKSSRHDSYVPRFEDELAQFCEKLVADLDRKLKRGRDRISQEQELNSLFPLSSEKSEQLLTVEEKMKKLLEQIEMLGEEGKIDEAQALMKKVDLLNAEKTAMIQQSANDRGLQLSQEKKMALCEICGSFLVANDAAERTQSHVTGKQHLGYTLVRDYLAEYNLKRDEEKLKKVEEKRKKEHDNNRVKDIVKDTQKEGYTREDLHNHRGRERDYRHHGWDKYGDRDRGSTARDRDYRERERRDRLRDQEYSQTRSRSSPLRSPFHLHSRHRSRSPNQVI